MLQFWVVVVFGIFYLTIFIVLGGQGSCDISS